MRIEELRIGNIVKINNTTVEFTKIDFNLTEDFINPIPLTEEWLMNFGFVRLGNQDTWFGRALWSKGKFAVMHGYGTTNGQRTKYDLIEFDYVHQLQNLYFALTGEELTIKN